MKSLVTLMLLIGIILFVVGYMKEELKCPDKDYPKMHVETVDKQIVNKPIMSVFSKMFEDSSPWMNANYDSTFTAGTTRNRGLY